ncbi:unnamed protein product [Brugia timori]|uniref:Virulence_fact domain-containing protein n=1 Tax=Brugia timori TaxID=42155 RepID=A0A0R3QHX5_9BILA|nr:unnamed protein product [Brugia timori]
MEAEQYLSSWDEAMASMPIPNVRDNIRPEDEEAMALIPMEDMVPAKSM